jgi:hypothetical protein
MDRHLAGTTLAVARNDNHDKPVPLKPVGTTARHWCDHSRIGGALFLKRRAPRAWHGHGEPRT